MKKLLLGLFALTTAVSFAQANVNTYVKLGVDLHSKFKYDDEGLNFSKKAKGYALFLENTYNLNENVELGLGLGLIARKSKKVNFVDDEGDAWKGDAYTYNSIPLYLIGKFNLNTNSAFKPYLKADLGYSFNRVKYRLKSENEESTAKAVGGLYAGIGFGAEYNNFVADLSYVHTAGKYKWDEGEKEKVKNRAVRLSVGYKFSF